MKFSEWLSLREMMGSVAAIPSCSYCNSKDYQVQGAYCDKCRSRKKGKRRAEWMEQNAARLSDYLKSKYGNLRKRPNQTTQANADLQAKTKIQPSVLTNPLAQSAAR